MSEINNLPTSSSLKELMDRQELLTNVIEIQKNNLKSILESKNVEVSEEENKLSILINKVNEMENPEAYKLWLYREGVFNDNYVRTPHNTSIINYNNDNFVLNGINSSYWVCRLAFENVDFTQYSTLHVECSLTLGSSQSSRNSTINVNAGMNSEGTSNPIGTKFTSAFSKSIKTIDISNINGVYYLNLTCFDTNLSVYKIWLTK